MFIPATVLVPEYVATTWCQTPMVTGGVSTVAATPGPLGRLSAKTGFVAPPNCSSAQPRPAGVLFPISVPPVFDPILNQPETENESVRSKLKLLGLARLAQVSPSKFTLPSISPGCC